MVPLDATSHSVRCYISNYITLEIHSTTFLTIHNGQHLLRDVATWACAFLLGKANLRGALTQLLWGVDCIQIVKVWIAKFQQTCIVFGTVRFWNLRGKQRTTNDMYKSKLEIWWNSPCETQSSGLKLAKLIQPRWLYNTLLLSSIKAVEVAAAFPGPSDSFDTRSRVSCTAETCWK